MCQANFQEQTKSSDPKDACKVGPSIDKKAPTSDLIQKKAKA